MAKEKDELLDHNYDGIQEYDNDLPRWWLNIFWLTTIFAICYATWTHILREETQQETLARRLKENQALRQEASVNTTANDIGNEELINMSADSNLLARAKANWDSKCVACHGANGEGLVGPNLTDKYWLHGGNPEDIRNVIRKGVLEKGMLAWETVMNPDEINEITAYVLSLQGTKPSNPKDPQGELFE
ncbi:MAG: c-type cytochrome [Bdellovibrionales bacterium]|nr:c-type cytochrome [Bdellovibrionales bacterium]